MTDTQQPYFLVLSTTQQKTDFLRAVGSDSAINSNREEDIYLFSKDGFYDVHVRFSCDSNTDEYKATEIAAFVVMDEGVQKAFFDKTLFKSIDRLDLSKPYKQVEAYKDLCERNKHITEEVRKKRIANASVRILNLNLLEFYNSKLSVKASDKRVVIKGKSVYLAEMEKLFDQFYGKKLIGVRTGGVLNSRLISYKDMTVEIVFSQQQGGGFSYQEQKGDIVFSNDENISSKILVSDHGAHIFALIRTECAPVSHTQHNSNHCSAVEPKNRKNRRLFSYFKPVEADNNRIIDDETFIL